MGGSVSSNCPSAFDSLSLIHPHINDQPEEIYAPGRDPNYEQLAPSAEVLPAELPPQLGDLFEMFLQFSPTIKWLIKNASLGAPVWGEEGELLDFDPLFGDEEIHHIKFEREIQTGAKRKGSWDTRASRFYAEVASMMDPLNAAILKSADHDAVHKRLSDLEGYQLLLAQRHLDLELFMIAALNLHFYFQRSDPRGDMRLANKLKEELEQAKNGITLDMFCSRITKRARTAKEYIAGTYPNFYRTYLGLRDQHLDERVQSVYEQ